MIQGFKAYTHYIKVKLHFSIGQNYNIMDKKGVKASVQSFEKRSDRYKFASIEKMKDYKLYILANVLDDPDKYIRDFGEEPFIRLKRIMANLSYTYKSFIKDSPTDNIDIKKSSCELMNEYKNGEVDIEIICILNNVLNFLPSWEEDKIFSFIYSKEIFVIKKYSSFFTEISEKFYEITINKYDRKDHFKENNLRK